MGVWAEWWWWCARPGRLPRAAPLSILLACVLTIISLLFLLNAKGVSQHSAPRQLLELGDHEFAGAPQHHPDLAGYIRQLHLVGYARDTPYRLQRPNATDYSQNGQSLEVARILNGKRGGVFVEAGAYNGEDLSNTLYLEKTLGWTGLLVEPDPWNFWALKKKGRKAQLIHACLSPTPFPREVNFKQSDTMGHIAGDGETRHGIYTRVKCFPLYSLLRALNTTTIDLLSLDIEGAELKVLQTIPWRDVRIQVVCVEYKHVPEGSAALKTFLEERGYALRATVGDDYIFARHDLDESQQQSHQKGL